MSPPVAEGGPPADEGLAAVVRTRLAVVRERIAAAGASPGRVTVVAVTKTFGLSAVRAALAAGLSDVGENYADELVGKATALEASAPGSGVRWHYLGAIQSNKVARLHPHVALYEGLDRRAEGEAIARRGGGRVLIEVDGSQLPGRQGVRPEEVEPLLEALLGLGLDVAGLMTVAPPGGGDAARRVFGCVGELVGRLGLREASMGMSEDLELAVAAGSTMVRVGTALFGARPGAKAMTE